MCSAYWSLKVPCLICPFCGATEVGSDLQTHFNGEPGDCLNYYEIGDKIPNLGDISGTLSSMGDALITSCGNCGEYLDYDAVIEKGRITGIKYKKNSYD